MDWVERGDNSANDGDVLVVARRHFYGQNGRRRESTLASNWNMSWDSYGRNKGVVLGEGALQGQPRSEGMTFVAHRYFDGLNGRWNEST